MKLCTDDNSKLGGSSNFSDKVIFYKLKRLADLSTRDVKKFEKFFIWRVNRVEVNNHNGDLKHSIYKDMNAKLEKSPTKRFFISRSKFLKDK